MIISHTDALKIALKARKSREATFVEQFTDEKLVIVTSCAFAAMPSPEGMLELVVRFVDTFKIEGHDVSLVEHSLESVDRNFDVSPETEQQFNLMIDKLAIPAVMIQAQVEYMYAV